MMVIPLLLFVIELQHYMSTIKLTNKFLKEIQFSYLLSDHYGKEVTGSVNFAFGIWLDGCV